FGTKSFQIGSDSGEAVMLTLNNMRSDTTEMGGSTYSATEGKDSSWKVGAENSELTMNFVDKDGKEQNISINAKTGDDIEEVATYINGQSNAINASVTGEGKLQVFASADASDIKFGGSLSSELGMGNKVADTVKSIDVTTVGGSQKAVAILDSAMQYVDSNRADLGAFQNRFGHAISNLENINENVNASNSQIKDVDFAKETTAMTKAQILQQASSSILAQAKQAPNAALGLLG
ncbi:flagellin, partial [Aliivibrio logei]